MFTGSIVALVTPMDEKGNVDRSSLKKLIDYHVASGTSAIVSVGTTGESATLSHEEHGDVVMTTLELADGRIPVIAGTGANATAEAISLTQRFNNTGVVGCLTVTPYYNRPTQEGLFQHFKTIAEHTDLPQILYNVPSRTGCDMLPETVGRLAQIKNIVGIQEATGNLSRVHQIKELVSDDFMCRLALAGQFAEARAINQRLMPLHTKLFVEPNPIPVKWGCKALGLVATDTLRLPMTPITDHGREAVTAALKHAGLL